MNIENIQSNKIREQILGKIKSGEVNMRPRYYFLFRLVLLGIAIFFIFILSAIIVSYVLFSIEISGQTFLLGFGARGFYQFIMTLPWLILLIDILFILFLDWLLKSFRFGYNNSILFLFIVTMASITLLGYLINFTSFHNAMLDLSERRNLPVAGGFYTSLRKSHVSQGMFRGEVVSINGTSTFYVKYNDYDSDMDGIVEVFVPSGHDVYSLMLHPGDEIFIAGNKIPSGIEAYGIHKLTNSR